MTLNEMFWVQWESRCSEILQNDLSMVLNGNKLHHIALILRPLKQEKLDEHLIKMVLRNTLKYHANFGNIESSTVDRVYNLFTHLSTVYSD